MTEDKAGSATKDVGVPDQRGEPGTFVQFMNLFLGPAEAEALPWRVTFPYGDPFRLDAGRTAKGDKYSPIATAIVRMDEGRSGKQLVPAVAWLSSVLGFATRSPTYASAITDRGPDAGGAWQESVQGSVSPPRFGRRKPIPIFGTPQDLRTIVDSAWSIFDRDGFIDSGIPDAFEWHNFARSGRELHYLDIQLAHHWIALEVLAARWAKAFGASSLLKSRQINEAREWLRGYAAKLGLDKADAEALEAKAAELGRRPMKAVVLAYLRQIFAPYPAQPVGDELEALIGACIKWRNDMVHVGSLAMHKMPRENGAAGVDRVLQAIKRLEALVARALLAEIEAPIALLADVPWTD